jgi:hypothetical protein
MLRWISILLFLLTSCEVYVTPETNVTLSGKYVVSKVRVQPVDQNLSSDTNYFTTDIFESQMPYPFDSFMVDNFFVHFDYSTVHLNQVGVNPGGADMWEIGPHFYWVLNNSPYYPGDLQFTYAYYKSGYKFEPTLTFSIEHDGLENLQIKSKGVWPSKEMGEEIVITFFMTRVGP